MSYFRLILFVGVSFLSGCNKPASWAVQSEPALRCDMTVQEVESIVRRSIIPREVARGWITHEIRDGGTSMNFGFISGKLKYEQIIWEIEPMRMAMYQKIDLCGLEPSNPDVVHPLINN